MEELSSPWQSEKGSQFPAEPACISMSNNRQTVAVPRGERPRVQAQSRAVRHPDSVSGTVRRRTTDLRPAEARTGELRTRPSTTGRVTGIRAASTLLPNSQLYCRREDRHPRKLFLQLEDKEPRRTHVHKPDKL